MYPEVLTRIFAKICNIPYGLANAELVHGARWEITTTGSQELAKNKPGIKGVQTNVDAKNQERNTPGYSEVPASHGSQHLRPAHMFADVQNPQPGGLLEAASGMKEMQPFLPKTNKTLKLKDLA